jgi:hypothetical protein
METDEEVALSPDDPEAVPVRQTRTNWAGSLSRELSQRAKQYARKKRPAALSELRSTPTVCFGLWRLAHGNFLHLDLQGHTQESKLATTFGEGPRAGLQLYAAT